MQNVQVLRQRGAKPAGGAVREGNVSDSDLAAFIAARDAAMPAKTQA